VPAPGITMATVAFIAVHRSRPKKRRAPDR
jgi:hypothetical protein